MPKWICGHVKKLNNHEIALEELRGFFKITKELMPKPIESIKNTSQIQIIKKTQNSQVGYDFAQIMSGYGSSEASSIQTSQAPKTTSDFFSALNDVRKAQDENQPSASNVTLSNSDPNSFQNILQKRREESEKKTKCKVVIKDKCTVAEANTSNLAQSRNLLERIYEILNEDENAQFKLALSKFYVAKKNSDESNKLKYFNILKLIFENKHQKQSDCLFNELKAFIRYKDPNCETLSACDRICLKRKYNEND